MFTWLSNLRLRWKVLFAPGLLILALIGVGTYFSAMQSSNQAAVDALMVGPVRQAEIVGDFSTTAWKAQVRLYYLMATAANETDEKKIKALGTQGLKALSEMADKFKELEGRKFENAKAAEMLGKLKISVAKYIKQAKEVIEDHN